MKTIYTQECAETPEGATHYKNIGMKTFFYQLKGFKVNQRVGQSWLPINNKDFNMSLLKKLAKPAIAKKAFEFLGSPENLPRYDITAEIQGTRKVIFQAFKDFDGRPVWITHEHEAVRNEFKINRIAKKLIQVINDNYDRIAGVKKPTKSKRVTVTRTTCPGSYYHSVQAG